MIPPATENSSTDVAADAPAARPDSSTRRRVAEPEQQIAIVGGGIAGCALAYALARRGIAAILLERGRLASLGASAVGAALLNPYRGRSGKPGPYDQEGLAAFWRLAAELEGAGLYPGAHRSGVLRIASNERQARAWDELPGLRRFDVPPPYRAPSGAFLAQEGGWVEPGRLIAALASSARAKGASIEEEFRVVRVASSGQSWSVHGEERSVTARVVVLCLGAGTVAGVPLPELERIAGDQVTLRVDLPLPFPLAGGVYLAGNGSRVFIGGNHRVPGTEDPRAPQLLRASAARLVPPLAEAPIERVWTGIRAKRPDNVPLLEELQPNLWYLGAFGGRGFLTAPLLADRLADTLSEFRN